MNKVRAFALTKKPYLRYQCHISSRNRSSSAPQQDYTIEEISIPITSQQKIACKLWKSTRGSELEPPIVCVHGWLDNAGSFDTLIPKLMKEGRTFYSYDLPGHGLSSHVPTTTTHYNTHSEFHLTIHKLIRYLKMEDVSLLGHSMGAEICVMFAGTFPKNVAKVVTIDGVCPTPPNWAEGTRDFVQSLFEAEELLGKSPHPKPASYDELLQRMLRGRQGVLTEESCRILLKRGALKAPGTEDGYQFSHDLKLRIHAGLAFLSLDQFVDFCANVESPLCVIKAVYEDESFSFQPSTNFQDAMELAKQRNPKMNVEFHKVEGNHHVHLNEPDKVASIINEFLSLSK